MVTVQDEVMGECSNFGHLILIEQSEKRNVKTM